MELITEGVTHQLAFAGLAPWILVLLRLSSLIHLTMSASLANPEAPVAGTVDHGQLPIPGSYFYIDVSCLSAGLLLFCLFLGKNFLVV